MSVLIEPVDLQAAMASEPMVVIDTRDPDVYAKGHLPGALWASPKDLFTEEMLTKLDVNRQRIALRIYREGLEPQGPIAQADEFYDQPAEKSGPQWHDLLIDLPAPETFNFDGVSVLEAIRSRRSRREYLPQPLTLSELAFLCWAVQGVRVEDSNAVRLMRRIISAMRANGQTRLVNPVIVYSSVITVVLYAAMTTLSNPAWKFRVCQSSVFAQLCSNRSVQRFSTETEKSCARTASNRVSAAMMPDLMAR